MRPSRRARRETSGGRPQRFRAFLVSWQVGFLGIRVGEASHPGPGCEPEGAMEHASDIPWPFESDEEFQPRLEWDIALLTPRISHQDVDTSSNMGQIQAQAAADVRHECKRNQCVRDKQCLQCTAKVAKKKWGQVCRGCGAFVCSQGCARTYMEEHQCSVERCLSLSVSQRVDESRADSAFEWNGAAVASQSGSHPATLC